ncbi:MAG: ATPase, T2SS/T4P/T4SS family [bacterium]
MVNSNFIIVKDILVEAVRLGASDVHFSVGHLPVVRVNYELVALEGVPVVTQNLMIDLMETILDERQKNILKQKKEIIFAYNVDNNLRFKISLFYQRGNLSATLRYVSANVPTVESLGLSKAISDLASLKKGLVIMAGSFGSGRSSTVAAIIEEINRNRKEYIVTIEDPIEYIFTNKKSVIEQREVGLDTNSFKDALDYFQEEDGDVLYLEKINDPRVIPLVLEIARGSSLVITSISADSVTKSITRILDDFQSFDQERIRDLLASSLKMVVCQRLLPKIGGGLVAVHEVMPITPSVKSVILTGNLTQLDSIIQTGARDGMISLDRALAELVKSGKITRKEALDNCSDVNSLENLIK